MPELLHVGPLALETSLIGLRLTDAQEAWRVRLRDATLATLERFVEVALARKVVAVLLVGPLLRHPGRSWRGAIALRAAATRLAEAGIPLVLMPASPEEAAALRALDAWPASTVGLEVEVAPPSGREVNELTFSRDNASLGMRVCPAQGPGDVDAIYRAIGGPASAPIPTAAPWISHLGSPQARSFEDETSGPGACIVTWENGRVSAVKVIPAAAVCLATLHIQLGEEATPAALAARIAASLPLAEGRLAVRVLIAGPGPLRAVLRLPDGTAELLALLRDLDADVWWDHAELLALPIPEGTAVPPDLRGLLRDELARASASPEAATGALTRLPGGSQEGDRDPVERIQVAGWLLDEMLGQDA